MKISIGRKVIAMMAVLGVVFLASTAFQQTQLYSNLIYFKQYEKDADSVNNILSKFAHNTDDINDTIQAMNEGINNIATAADESARGVSNVAENAVGLVEAITHIQEETENNQNISSKLSEEVSGFKKL